MPLSDSDAALLEANLFPVARAMVRERPDFPWHRDRRGAITAKERHSSQALALDVFETIRRLDSRTAICTALARWIGVPDSGPWNIEPEFLVDRTVLGEPRPTQVDAALFGRESVILVECKFTEPDGGSCSQPIPLQRGLHKGAVQCNGSYEQQLNAVNGKSARCALSGKGVRYWKHVPAAFNLLAEADYRPCPFRGGAYQWMRNIVAASALGASKRLRPSFVVAYADGDGLPMAAKLQSQEWADFITLTNGKVPLRTASYQMLIDLASGAATSSDATVLSDLRHWIHEKIADTTAPARSLR